MVKRNRLKFLNWELIYIDTCVKGQHYGEIQSDIRLRFNETCPKRLSDSNTHDEVNSSDCLRALVMHHPLIALGTPKIDKYKVRNFSEVSDFFDPNEIQLILHGHVNNFYQYNVNQIPVASAPATCFQYTKGNDSEIDTQMIGYLVHTFTPEMHSSILVRLY